MSVRPTNTARHYYKGGLDVFFLCISLKIDPFDIYHRKRKFLLPLVKTNKQKNTTNSTIDAVPCLCRNR